MIYDIGIIGGGIAGLTAAIYGRRAGKDVLLSEGSGFGGQITMSAHVDNYPGMPGVNGADLMEKIREQAEALGVQMQNVPVQGIRVSGAEEEEGTGQQCAGGQKLKYLLTSEGEIACKAVIIATGVKHRKLGVPGEDLLAGSGVSYCAVCDGAFFRKMKVAVVGGGSTALQDAAYLSDLCSEVYLIHRRDEFRGENKLVEDLREKENVRFILDTVVTSIKGGFFVESLGLKNKKTGEETELAVDGVFLAVGMIPGNQAFADVVDLDEDGYIIAGEDCKTSVEGIFAAGDCRTKEVRQLVTAAADGAVAAIGALAMM